MNSVCLVGRLTRNPTVRFEGDSQTATFTLAVDERSYGPARKAYVLYVPCTSFGRSAEACSLLSAEDLVAVQGRLGWQKRKAQCGQEHSMLVVHVREVQVLQDTAALTGRP
jgi:single-stranded DNA-binding protein